MIAAQGATARKRRNLNVASNALATRILLEGKRAIGIEYLQGGAKHTARGGEMILAATNGDGRTVIDVIDTGSGVSPEAQAKIFQAYYSTKKGGTGLGLAMAKRIAEEHGGALSVTSEMGKGSDFTITLPVQ